jgi:AcrR family transcriptional regulator
MLGVVDLFIAPDAPPLTRAAKLILDAASGLFYANGIHAVGVERVAAAAGVTKKTIYDRFGSKEQLVLAYLRRREAGWREAVLERLGQDTRPGPDRVLAVFDAAMHWYAEIAPKGCSAVNARAEALPQDDKDEILLEVQSQKAWMLSLFVQLCAEAGIPDKSKAPETLMLLLDGALVTMGMRTFPEPLLLAREAAKLTLAAASAVPPVPEP